MIKTLLPTLTLSDGRVFPLKPDGLKIGSMAGVCDIVLDDAQVSPIHCAIVKNEGGFAVKELQSNIGIAVDGVTVAKGSTTPLADGSVITVDTETLTFNEPKTLFTAEELAQLDDVALKIGRGDVVAAADAQAAIGILQDKIDLIATICDVSDEDAADISDRAVDFSDLEAADDEPTESPFASRQKPEDQIDETKIFESAIDETQLPTICFLTPTAKTSKQFHERAICVKVVPFTIGADAANDYVMANTFRISAWHAEIIQDANGGFELKNKDSRYGTYVNGKLIQPEETVPIKVGDTLTFGTHEYSVEAL